MAKAAKKLDASTRGQCMRATSIQRGTILTCRAGLRGLNRDASVQIPLHRARASKPVTINNDRGYFDLRLVCKRALVKRAAFRVRETELVQ